MLPRITLIALVLLTAFEGCAKGPTSKPTSIAMPDFNVTDASQSCPNAGPPGTVAFDSTHLSRLLGAFIFTVVDTSWLPPDGAYASSQTRLTLAMADSVQRARSRERRIGYGPRANLQLVGTLRSM